MFDHAFHLIVLFSIKNNYCQIWRKIQYKYSRGNGLHCSLLEPGAF